VEGALIASKHIEKMAARLEGPELVSLANYSLGANDEMVERLVKVLPTVAAELGALGKVEELASMLRLHDSPSNERANAAIIRELVALGPDVTKHVMDEARDGNDTTKLHAIDVMQGLGDDERASELEDLLSSGPLLRDIVVEPVVDERTGDLMLRTVREADFALPAVALEHMQRYAPLVAQRILESTGRTWGWPPRDWRRSTQRQ